VLGGRYADLEFGRGVRETTCSFFSFRFRWIEQVCSVVRDVLSCAQIWQHSCSKKKEWCHIDDVADPYHQRTFAMPSL
jgi:hypothetical protein